MTTNSRYISPAKKAWITRKIKSGKSKYQTARELNLNETTVYKIARGLPSKPCGWPGIRGKTLEILQELVSKGYYICSHNDPKKRFFLLKKSFPTLYRTKMNRKTIFYLEGHEDDAARAFLGAINKKIISYKEIAGITDVFHANLSKQEKESFLGRNRSKRTTKQKDSKIDSLGEKQDSLAYFYIRKYCTTVVPKVGREEGKNYRKLLGEVISEMEIPDGEGFSPGADAFSSLQCFIKFEKLSMFIMIMESITIIFFIP